MLQKTPKPTKSHQKSKKPTHHRKATTKTNAKRHFSTTNTTKAAVKTVFENKLSPQDKFKQFALTILPPYTATQAVTTFLFSPETSIAVPCVVAVASTALAAYNWQNQRDRCTEITIAGPNDPVMIKTPSFWGGEKLHTIARDKFLGLASFEYSKNYVNPDVPFFCRIEGRKTPFVLSRQALYDTSGDLNPILGVDVTTYERCPPSAPYDHQAALAVAQAFHKTTTQQQQGEVVEKKVEKKADPSNEV